MISSTIYSSLTALVTFITTIVIVWIGGPELRGAYAVAFSLLLIIQSILGFPLAILDIDYGDNNSLQIIHGISSFIFWNVIFATCVTYIISLILNLDFLLIFLICIGAIFSCVENIVRKITYRYSGVSIITLYFLISKSILLIVYFVCFLLKIDISVYFVLTFYIALQLICCGMYIGPVNLSSYKLISLSFANLKQLLKNVKRDVRALFHGFCTTSILRSDIIIVASILTLSDSGIYAAVITLCGLITAIYNQLGSYFRNALIMRDFDYQIFLRIIFFMFAIMFLGILCIQTLGSTILSLIYGEEFEIRNSLFILVWMNANLWGFVNMLAGTVEVKRQYPFSSMLAVALFMSVSVLGNLIFMPHFGLIVAPATSFFAYMGMLCFYTTQLKTIRDSQE